MITFRNRCAIAAVALALPMAAMSSGHAAPLAPGQPLAAAHAGADNSLVTQVQWRRRGYYRGGGAGLGIGLAAGALIGGAIAAGANPYYGPGYGYGYGYGGPAHIIQRPLRWWSRQATAAAMPKLTVCAGIDPTIPHQART